MLKVRAAAGLSMTSTPMPRVGQPAVQPGMRKALPRAGAEQDDLRRKAADLLEVRFGERLEPMLRPRLDDRIRGDDQTLAMLVRPDAHPPRSGAGEKIAFGVREMELHGAGSGARRRKHRRWCIAVNPRLR